MNILEKILYYGFGSLVVYYLFKEGASYVKESFVEGVNWVEKKFPRTTAFLKSIFFGVETFLEKNSLRPLDFRLKISDKRIDLFINKGGADFEKVSSSNIESSYSFKIKEIEYLPNKYLNLSGGTYDFKGFFDSIVWEESNAFLSVIDKFITDLCMFEKNQPSPGQCELILSLECGEFLSLEFYFGLALVYGVLKGDYERKYSGLEYPVKLRPSCGFSITDIDLDSETFRVILNQ